jgi:NitT/TauT family transport system permease protein
MSYSFLYSPFFIKTISLLVLFIIWNFFSTYFDIETLPSPYTVFIAFQDELLNGSLLYHLSITLYRVLISFSLAMVVGVFFGILMGNNEKINNIFDTWNIIFLNIPALVLIILSYVWFGLTELAAIIAVSLNKIPNVIITVREGAKTIDKQLLEVASIYKVKKVKRFFVFYLPQLYPYLIASARGGISLIWKIVLVVELLGRSNGVGFKLHEFFQFFDIAAILAYTFAFVIIMISIENFIFLPLDRKANKWRNN